MKETPWQYIKKVFHLQERKRKYDLVVSDKLFELSPNFYTFAGCYWLLCKKVVHYINTTIMSDKKKTTGSKASAKSNKKKATKVSATFQPEKMSLEDWQIALRKQTAEKESFLISFVDKQSLPGDYFVKNPQSGKTYKVVYRGVASDWNYCSCLDFKTSCLSTCKHIEALKLWLKKKRLGIPGKQIPAYTSVYLSYREKREVKIRIGTEQAEAFRQLAHSYFTEEGVLRKEAYPVFADFLSQAQVISPDFRCYDDAFSHIIEERERVKRQAMLARKYPDNRVDGLLNTSLYPYQHKGILFAASAGKCIIADEMGLGKTIQAIGTTELLRKEQYITSALIICPTSLKYQWKSEIKKFTGLEALVVEGSPLKRKELYQSDAFFKIVSYHTALNDVRLLISMRVDMLIMDEAQRLKNWNTQIAQAVKRIESDYTIILSGTPLENKLEELYSVVQYVDQYCLGPYYRFINQFTLSNKDTGKRIGYQHLNSIGELLKDRLIRRKKRDVALQLPERQDKILLMPMTQQQMEIHEEYKGLVSMLIRKWVKMRFLSEKDRKRLLLFLSMMRMVSDSTYILDQKTRYDTKIGELMQIISNVVESGDEKVVVFSQWERMTRLVVQELDNMKIGYEYLHGGIPSEKRKDLTSNFTSKPESRIFVSTDAGSTGLNLQAASIIVNLDLPWNPAILEQRIARIYRIGQKRNIQVINFVSKDTIEERMLDTLSFKTSLFEGILDNGEDAVFLENNKFDKLMHLVEELHLDSDKGKGQDEPITVQQDEIEKIIPEAPTSPQDECLVEPAKELSAPDELLQQGMSFFSNLAQTLASPDKTEELLSSLIEEDKETGQTTLRIPVNNKETVSNVLQMFGRLFSQMGENMKA